MISGKLTCFAGIIAVAILITSCGSKINQKKAESVETGQDENTSVYIDTLRIEGNQIWVRSKPVDGEVVLKLDEGAVCYVLEKGDEQTIRGNSDFWYKIEHANTTGWVFGSQTSIKQIKSEEINVFFKRFLNDICEAEWKDVDLLKFVSEIHGIDYYVADCNSLNYNEAIVYNKKHYRRNDEVNIIFQNIWMAYTDPEITEGGEVEHIESDGGEVAVVFPLKPKANFTGTFYKVVFSRIEGSWYLTQVYADACNGIYQSATTDYNFEKYLKEYRENTIFNQGVEKQLKEGELEASGILDSNVGLHVFTNPGAACVSSGMGDYLFRGLVIPKDYKFYGNIEPKGGFCEPANEPDGIYYDEVDKLRMAVYIDEEGYRTQEITLPEYMQHSPIMRVRVLTEGWLGSTLYFVSDGESWYLVLVDNCDCSA